MGLPGAVTGLVLTAVQWPGYLFAAGMMGLGAFLLLPGRAEQESRRHRRRPFPFLTLLSPQVPFLRNTMPPAVVRFQAVVYIVGGVVGLTLMLTGVLG